MNNFGIELHALSIEGLAFANLIEGWDTPPPELSNILNLNEEEKPKKNIQIILNIGHKKTLFTAFENKRLIFTRGLFCGSHQLINAIIKKQEISYIEALRFLQTKAAFVLNKENMSYEQVQISELLSRSLTDLVRDIQMTIIELQSEFNATITDLHFTGGASLLPNLGGFLTQNLEISCNPINLLQSYAGSLSSVSSTEKVHEIEARFATAFGIGLEAFKKSVNPATNLLKGEFAKQNDDLKIFWKRWGNVAAVGLTAILILFIWTSFRDTMSLSLNEKIEEAVTSQAKTVARLPKKQANESGVKKYIKENKKRAAELKMVEHVTQMNSALDILKKIIVTTSI